MNTILLILGMAVGFAVGYKVSDRVGDEAHMKLLILLGKEIGEEKMLSILERISEQRKIK